MSGCYESDTICVDNSCYIINGWSLNVKDINSSNSPYNALPTDVIIFADASTAPVTINLSSPPTFKNQMYMIRKIDNTYNSVTITPSGGTTIDGNANYVLGRPDEVIYLVYDSTVVPPLWRFITNKTERILTTKGDLLTRNSSTAVRLPVGIDGQVLTADSAQATGLTWTTPSSMAGRITIMLMPIKLEAVSQSWTPMAYFPWILSRHSLYTNGYISLNATGNLGRSLDVRYIDVTNNVILGSVTGITTQQFLSFSVLNPITDAQCELQIRKNDYGGQTNPTISGVILEFN